jgi:YidC/Oxa1 family membrane protein insertase
MGVWAAWVHLLGELLVSMTAATHGNLGAAVVLLSLAVRLSLLPLSLSMARRARARVEKMRVLQPELEALQKRFAKDPERLTRETIALYKQHNVPVTDWRSLGGGLLQFPIAGGIYSAIRDGLGVGRRFLWIADLARPDVLVMLVTVGFSMLAAWLNPNLPASARWMAMLVPSVMTAFMLWHLSAGLGLYMAAANAVSVVQSVMLRPPRPRRVAKVLR